MIKQMDIVHAIESLFPKKWIKEYRVLKRNVTAYRKKKCIHKKYRKIREEKRSIRIVFFALVSSNWKFDYLYRLLEKDANFEPFILVCPVVNKGREYMLYELNATWSMLSNKGYIVYKAYDENTDTYIDVKNLKPDIIFYTNPYKGLVDDRYYIDKYPDILSCYANYSFEIIPHEFAFNTPFHEAVWRYFVETEYTLNLVKKYSRTSGRNAVNVGYPMFDCFREHVDDSPYWKIKDRKVKRIIWAPHQSIIPIDKNDRNQVAVQFSTFLLYSDFMLELAKMYKNQVQIVFKPHQLLRLNLYEHPDWGREKTDSYYELWEKGDNTNYCSSDYVDLFKSSDALIHDCGSFTAEYMCMKKPVMYLANYITESDFNDVGTKLFNAHYKGMSTDDIENFISDVVIKGEDSMATVRHSVYQNVLLPPNGLTASQNIINEIKNEILYEAYEDK